jgi:hypothetical protein
MSWVRERRVPLCREREAMLKKRARRMRNVRRKRVRVKRARVTSRWVWSWAERRELNGAGLAVVGRPISGSGTKGGQSGWREAWAKSSLRRGRQVEAQVKVEVDRVSLCTSLSIYHIHT